MGNVNEDLNLFKEQQEIDKKMKYDIVQKNMEKNAQTFKEKIEKIKKHRAKKEKHFQEFGKINNYLNKEKMEKRDERRKLAKDQTKSDYRMHQE